VERAALVRWVLLAALAVMLLSAAVDVPNRWDSLARIWPVVQQWGEPDVQQRMQAEDWPHAYDLLRQADAVIPKDAAVLVVTSGEDTRGAEYITFHRALYLLAPRQVWWTAPTAPGDDWKSRWWIPSDITPEAVRKLAAERGAKYVLTYGLDEPLEVGEQVLENEEGTLHRLAEGAALAPQAAAGAWYAGPLWPLWVALAVAVVVALGYGLLAVAARLGCRVRGVEGLGLAWALGAGAVSLAMLWLGALGVPLQWQAVMLTGVAVAVVALLLRARMAGTPPAPDPPTQTEATGLQKSSLGFRIAKWAAVLVIGVQAVWVALHAIGRPLIIWDSWVNWAVKARSIFIEGGISPAVYADPSRAVTHLDYPLLLPLLQAWHFAWVGAPDDRIAAVVPVLYYLSLVAVVYGVLLRQVGQGVALAAAVVVATMGTMAGLAAAAFAEVALATYALIAAVYLLEWMQGGSRGALLIAALAGGLMTWSKREGVILLAALVLGVVLAHLRSRRAWGAAGAMFAAAVVMSGPWYAFTALYGIPSPDLGPVSPATLIENIGRWRLIASLERGSLGSATFSYVWPVALLVGVAALLFRGGPARRTLVGLAVGVCIYLVGVGLSYVFSDFAPLEQHILSSVDRLIAPAAPLAVVWLVLWTLPSATKEQAHT
jgi:hypothetical protein